MRAQGYDVHGIFPGHDEINYPFERYMPYLHIDVAVADVVEHLAGAGDPYPLAYLSEDLGRVHLVRTGKAVRELLFGVNEVYKRTLDAGGYVLLEMRAHANVVWDTSRTDDERRAAATLGDDPWPGADALHHAEAALVAPDAEGLHTWEAAVLTEGLETVHTAGRARFGVRVVSAPACRLTVVAADAESGEPVAGARVVAHPYRAVTDERGAAELRVAAGRYRLFVSGRGSIPFRFDGEVQADTTIHARLARDVELSDADIWS